MQLKLEQKQYQSQVEVLTDKVNELNSVFDDLPENMTRLARLKRSVKTNEELYMTLSEQYAEMSLWRQTQFGKGQQVDEAYIPGQPVEPNTRLFLLVGLMLGTIAGVGFIFSKEVFNNSIDGVNKLKEFEAPMLAVVPDMKSYIKEEHGGTATTSLQHQKVSSTLVTLLNPVNPISESFRGLEANILHSDPDNDLNALMVTSTTKSEGKTTIASNLAVVMAEANQKVLLVDTDLRRPHMHNMFQIERSPGIVDYLFDNVDLHGAIRGTIIPNLNILPAGYRPPNPPAITKSGNFFELLEKLKEDYDRVILDTSPYGIIKDSSTFTNLMDGIVVVTRFGKTRYGELEHTFHSLERINANITGTVLNGFNPDRNSDYYYGYNYYKDFYRDYEEYEETDYWTCYIFVDTELSHRLWLEQINNNQSWQKKRQEEPLRKNLNLM